MNFDLVATIITLLTFFGIAAIMALSLNLEYGLAGIPNFGKALFVSIGAYTAGITYTRLLPLLAGKEFIDPCGDTLPQALALRTGIIQNWPGIAFVNLALTILIAALIGGVAGFLTSYIALRVKEEWYLGLVLLVGSEVIRIIVRGYDPIICGINGLSGLTQPFGFISNPTLASAGFAVLVVIIALLVYIYVERLVRSPYGRLLKAMRENDRVVLGLGKHVPRLRAQVMFIGSMLAALAGVLFAVNLGFVSTNDYGVSFTLDVWVMVVLGGVGNNRGALFGALVVTILNRVTAILSIWMNASGSPFEFNYVRYIVFALILLWVLRYRRQGLLPEHAETTVAHDELGVSS
ncbi:MAG: branched-chain amino acid ABC transporter permease [Anaerolineae bacterium]|nr:branched-chain amino acid ABC transporter permease [Anaerolineae bacterium]